MKILRIVLVLIPLGMLAATFSVRPLPDANGPLEPSIQNEVDHAVDLGEAWLAGQKFPSPATNRVELVRDLFATNGLSREQIAIKLISTQKGEGWWMVATNSAPTRLALDILKGL